MSDRLIINYADGVYAQDQPRLVKSCEALGLPIKCYGSRDRFTPHSVFPYYFKVDCLLDAAKYASILLWVDSAVVATGSGSVEPIFEHIEHYGYLLEKEDLFNSQYCNDASLRAFGFTRDEASKQHQVRGFFWGVDLLHPTGRFIIDELVRCKPLFKGRHTNEIRSESQDSRCLGHRHDQSVLSLLAAKRQLHLPYWYEHNWCHYGQNLDYVFNELHR